MGSRSFVVLAFGAASNRQTKSAAIHSSILFFLSMQKQSCAKHSLHLHSPLHHEQLTMSNQMTVLAFEPYMPRPSAPPVSPSIASSSSPIPYAIHVSTPLENDYCDRDVNGIRLFAWGAGICGCMQHIVPNCCMATFLPCVSLAQITARLGLYRFSTVIGFFLSILALQLLVAIISYVQLPAMTINYDRSTPSYTSEFSWPFHYRKAETDEQEDDNSSTFSSASTFFSKKCLDMAVSPWGWICGLLGLIYLLTAWQLRMHIRDRFRIRGAWWSDCLLSIGCFWCIVAQMATHVKSYRPGNCAFKPSVTTLPPYPA